MAYRDIILMLVANANAIKIIETISIDITVGVKSMVIQFVICISLSFIFNRGLLAF